MIGSSHDRFVKWFKEYYYHEFPNLSTDFKNKIIEEVIYNNQKYITLQMVLDADACTKCGRCCEGQHCLDYDKKTKLCTRHDDPIHEFCINYPWGSEEFGIAPVTLNCQYMVKVFIQYFDDYFANLKEGEV